MLSCPLENRSLDNQKCARQQEDKDDEIAMSSTQRYADPRAFEEYEENDGQEIVTSVLVDLSAGDALDAWLEHVWLGFREVAPGTGRGLVGHTRQVPLGIVEQIVSVGLPSDTDAQLIPSIHYKLRKFGPLPLSDHIGFVRFVQDTTAPTTSPKTLVLWTVKITPTATGNVFLCGGSLLRISLRSALSYFLGSMQRAIRASVPHATKRE